jgi:DNA-binding CsgD family transcriptional regulator
VSFERVPVGGGPVHSLDDLLRRTSAVHPVSGENGEDGTFRRSLAAEHAKTGELAFQPLPLAGEHQQATEPGALERPAQLDVAGGDLGDGAIEIGERLAHAVPPGVGRQRHQPERFPSDDRVDRTACELPQVHTCLRGLAGFSRGPRSSEPGHIDRVRWRGFGESPAAAVLAAVGAPADGRSLLEEALDRYDAIGASWYASRANARLREIGGRRGARGSRRRALSGWESLTSSELAVVELVAEGLTNREVAKRLFISPHTVNSHLRHSFRKLDVSTRAALAVKVSRVQSG